jgi:hypothetical protein
MRLGRNVLFITGDEVVTVKTTGDRIEHREAVRNDDRIWLITRFASLQHFRASKKTEATSEYLSQRITSRRRRAIVIGRSISQ